MTIVDTRNTNPKNLIAGATGEWEVVVGLEIHAQVLSKAKLFSGAPVGFGGAPNEDVSTVDAAMPGMLPVINEECVKQAIRTGLGLKAKINKHSVFARKNYFYPDLPQGYQISQYDQPIVGEGTVILEVGPDRDGNFEEVRVGIERLHLEQDAGKSLHDRDPSLSHVDLNRSGVALMEIVSKPDMRSADEAKAYIAKLRTILRYLGTSDADMEKGNLRADINVSVRRPGAPFGTRCEIKNVNSIRFAGQAIDHEARRQIGVLEDGGAIDQETRLFDAARGETRSMRTKEEAHDYRYFPDPDLLPLEFDDAYVAALAAGLPELPDEKWRRLVSTLDISAYQASVLVSERVIADFFEHLVMLGIPAKQAANWVINVVLADRSSGVIVYRGSEDAGSAPPVTEAWMEISDTGPVANAEILKMVESNELSITMAKDLRRIVGEQGPTNDPSLVRKTASQRGLKQVTDTGAIEALVDQVIAANAEKAEQVKAKPSMVGWFVGQVMKASGGKANPQAVNALLKEKLGLG